MDGLHIFHYLNVEIGRKIQWQKEYYSLKKVVV